MKSTVVLIITSIFISFFLPSAFANDICTFSSIDNFLEYEVSNDLTFYNSQSCNFEEPIDFTTNILLSKIHLSTDNDFIFSLVDINNKKITSLPIRDSYSIWNSNIINLALDPFDFKNENNNFDFQNVVSIQLYVTDTLTPIIIEDIKLEPIQTYPNFTLSENLPVSNTVFSFLILLMISLPSGILCVHYCKVFEKYDFVIKIPISLGIGFVIFLLFSFLASFLWISFEIILIFTIIEYLLLFLFYIRHKNKIKINSYQTLIFFSLLIIISGIISTQYFNLVGWPTSFHDGHAHNYMISLTTANNYYPHFSQESFLPIRDIPYDNTLYPKGSHMTASALSLFSNSFPATSMDSMLHFVMFLIPLLLASIVYKFSNSIFLTSLTFFLFYFRPNVTTSPLHWPNDVILYANQSDFFAAQVGMVILILFFILSFDFFKKENGKLKILALSFVVLASLIVTYSGFIAIPIFVLILSLFMYKKPSKKIIILFIILIIIFSSLPIWKNFLLGDYAELMLDGEVIFRHHKYLLHPPWVISDGLFPFWISSIIAFFSSIWLVTKKSYRFLALPFIVLSIIQLLSLSEEMTKNYVFYHQSMRSLGLWFLFSIIINLITINLLVHNVKKLNYVKHSQILKFLALGIILILLIPSGMDWWSILNDPNNVIRIPGGNEKNLQYWIYSNVDENELVLNDLSYSTQWVLGFKAQELVNFQQMDKVFQDNCNLKKVTLDDFHPICSETITINDILLRPWDYEYIQNTLSKYDIKYVYLSERHGKDLNCIRCLSHPELWGNWKYSDDARIAMYENHPNLELILRNGGSAIFKVQNTS